MTRGVGLAVAAVILSVTVGVLVGLVVHTGMRERADHSAPAAGTDPTIGAPSSSTSSTLGGSTSWQVSTMVTGDEAAVGESSPATASGASTLLPATSTVTVTNSASTGNTAPTVPTSTVPTSTVPTSTVPTSTVPTSTVPTSSTTATSTTPATNSASSTPVPPGKQAAGGPCRKLGNKSATAAGATLFCQHDQSDGSLRWRAVTARGGCLNQKMTGIGLDGHHYACRRDPGGLNHWKRVG